jgi:hypothetical protein
MSQSITWHSYLIYARGNTARNILKISEYNIKGHFLQLIFSLEFFFMLWF